MSAFVILSAMVGSSIQCLGSLQRNSTLRRNLFCSFCRSSRSPLLIGFHTTLAYIHNDTTCASYIFKSADGKKFQQAAYFNSHELFYGLKDQDAYKSE